MIFISLPLYRHPVPATYYGMNATTFNTTLTGGGFTDTGWYANATTEVAAPPPVEYISINIAHIGSINSNSPGFTFVNLGSQSWQIAMTKDQIFAEIRAAIETARATPAPVTATAAPTGTTAA